MHNCQKITFHSDTVVSLRSYSLTHRGDPHFSDTPHHPCPQNNQYIPTIARCLQLLLRVDEYRHAFLRVDGVSTLLSVLSSGVNFQCQYQLVFCLWVLTFNGEIAERMGRWVRGRGWWSWGRVLGSVNGGSINWMG